MVSAETPAARAAFKDSTLQSWVCPAALSSSGVNPAAISSAGVTPASSKPLAENPADLSAATLQPLVSRISLAVTPNEFSVFNLTGSHPALRIASCPTTLIPASFKSFAVNPAALSSSALEPAFFNCFAVNPAAFNAAASQPLIRII